MKILALLFIAAGLCGQSIDSAAVDAIIRDALVASRTRARIFEPLGISGVKLTSTEAQQAADHASPHMKAEGGSVEITNWYQDDKQVRPAGSIKAGVRDLSQWVRVQLSGGAVDGKRLVSRKNLMETHRPQIVIPGTDADQMFAAYGMGWRI